MATPTTFYLNGVKGTLLLDTPATDGASAQQIQELITALQGNNQLLFLLLTTNGFTITQKG